MEETTKSDSNQSSGKSLIEPSTTLRDCDQNDVNSSNTSTPMLKPNSNNSLNSTGTMNTSPKTNNNDHSNNGNSIIDNNSNGELLQDLHCNDKTSKRKTTFVGNNTNSLKDDAATSEKTKSITNASIMCPLSLKEEPSNTSKIKKEENNLSPVSPVGFDSISTVELASSRCVSSVKLNDLSGQNCKNNINESISPNSGVNCKDDTISNINSANNGLGIQQSFNSNNNNGSTAISNCLEYMQQQNHIFVFSTQLANKGAESVLSGQYQTIIAYHYTQPSTKTFLAEFFMKNPMKMSKLPRNMLNIAHGINNQWSNSGIPSTGGISKMTSKTANNKSMNFNLHNIDQKPPMGRTTTTPTHMSGFPESTIDSDSELINCWEQNRNVVTSDIKLGENMEAQHLSNMNNKSNLSSTIETKVGIGVNDQIPSLQGVKVPDENLTPQQRQHREEQLAKLKKMNQFLFPEHDSGSNNTQQLPKPTSDGAPNGINNILMNISGQQSNISGLSSMGNSIRNNVLQNQKPSTAIGCDGDVLPSAVVVSNEPLSADNIPSVQTKGNNLNCEPMNSGVMSVNLPSTVPSILMSNVTDPVGGGNFNKCGAGDDKIVPSSVILGGTHDVSPMEWTKLQHQFIDDRSKSNKASNDIVMNRLNSNSAGNCTNTRTNLSQVANGNNVQRAGQGPPPPYHSTQRSASVPIAIQSPNPSSPNNPTSNLSLPSPASAGGPIGVAITTNSPNMDMPSTSNLVNTSANCGTTHSGSTSQINKGGFNQEASSPLSSNNSNANRNRTNQLNSNPSTPLSHMSPKDLDAFNTNAGTDSQQTNIDGRFPSASPNFNFNPHLQNSGGNINAYKTQLERQNSATGPNSQFGRRTDNMPLNPNSNRSAQNKISGVSFDPISSLAQMSQQLTSCVAGGVGVGNSPSNMGCNDLSIPSNIPLNHQNGMDGMLPNIENSVLESGNMASQIVGNNGGIPFVPGGNCNMNSMMLGPLNPQHRMMNSKMCGAPGAFNNSVNSNAPGNFHGVMTPNHHRLRMPGMNFGNFNVSPNIQVKASTPNTIQYMPVRPQNNNNMRAPPSLDFLQRYANPAQINGGGPNIIENHAGGNMGQMNSTCPQNGPEGSKITNNINSGGGNNAGMNFFQHCNQVEQDDMSGTGMSQTSSHDINIGIMRGLRPMIRQPNMGSSGSNSGPRMLAPNNNGGPIMQYPNGQPPQDALDCGDMSNIFGPNNPNQMFAVSGGTNKLGKASGMVGGISNVGMCSNLSGNNAINLLPHDHNGMPSSLNQANMMPHNVIPNSNGPQLPVSASSNMSYKPFVGPTSNDLKYAQQYHSFQQQLYATSTRSQQQNGNGIASVASNVQNANAPFFVNK